MSTPRAHSDGDDEFERVAWLLAILAAIVAFGSLGVGFLLDAYRHHRPCTEEIRRFDASDGRAYAACEDDRAELRIGEGDPRCVCPSADGGAP